jgi:hypothetical protein
MQQPTRRRCRAPHGKGRAYPVRHAAVEPHPRRSVKYRQLLLSDGRASSNGDDTRSGQAAGSVDAQGNCLLGPRPHAGSPALAPPSLTVFPPDLFYGTTKLAEALLDALDEADTETPLPAGVAKTETELVAWVPGPVVTAVVWAKPPGRIR